MIQIRLTRDELDAAHEVHTGTLPPDLTLSSRHGFAANDPAGARNSEEIHELLERLYSGAHRDTHTADLDYPHLWGGP